MHTTSWHQTTLDLLTKIEQHQPPELKNTPFKIDIQPNLNTLDLHPEEKAKLAAYQIIMSYHNQDFAMADDKIKAILTSTHPTAATDLIQALINALYELMPET